MLQKIKLKKLKYSENDILDVFELLENESLHPQEIAKHVSFSGRQIKKLRYIRKHMMKYDFEDLLSCNYYISSIERRIKERIKKEKGKKITKK
jgi:hypothetical protein